MKSRSQAKIKITSTLLDSSQKLPTSSLQDQGQFSKYSKNSKLLMDQLILKRAYEEELPIKNDSLKQDFKQLQDTTSKNPQVDLFCFVDPKSILFQPIEAMRSVLIDNYTDEDDDSNIFSDHEHNEDDQGKTRDIKKFTQKMNAYMKSVETQYRKYKNEQITMETIQNIQEFYQKGMNGFLLELYKYSTEFKRLGQRIYMGLELSFQCLLRHHVQECKLYQLKLQKQKDKIDQLKQQYNYLRNDVDEINTLVPKVHMLLENLKIQEQSDQPVSNFSSQLEYLTKKEEYMLNIFENEKKQLALTKIERLIELRNKSILGNKKKEISRSVEKFQPSNVEIDLKGILSQAAKVTQNYNDLVFEREDEEEQQRWLNRQAQVLRHDWKGERAKKINQVKNKLVDKMAHKLLKPLMKDRFTSTQEDFVPIKDYIRLQEMLAEKKKQLEQDEYLFQVKDANLATMKKERDEIKNKLEYNQTLYQNLKLFNKTKKFYIAVIKKEYEEVLDSLIKSGLKYAEIIQESTNQVSRLYDDSLIQSITFNQNLKSKEFVEQLLNSQKLVKRSLDELDRTKKQQSSKNRLQNQSSSPVKKQQKSNSKVGGWKDDLKEESSEFDSQESFDSDYQNHLKSKQGQITADKLTQNKEFQKLKQRYSVLPNILKDQVAKLSEQMESEKNMKFVNIDDQIKLNRKKRIQVFNRSNSLNFNQSEFESPIKLQKDIDPKDKRLRLQESPEKLQQKHQQELIQKRKAIHSQIFPTKNSEFENQEEGKTIKSPEKNYQSEPFNLNNKKENFQEAASLVNQQYQSDIKIGSVKLGGIKEEESFQDSEESKIKLPKQVSSSSSSRDTISDSEYFEIKLNEPKKNSCSVGIQKSLYLHQLTSHFSPAYRGQIGRNEAKDTQTEIINCICEVTNNKKNSPYKRLEAFKEQRKQMKIYHRHQSQDLISHLQFILTNNENFKKEMLQIGFTKYMSDNRIHQTRTILELLLKKLNIDQQPQIKVPSPTETNHIGPWSQPQISDEEEKKHISKSKSDKYLIIKSDQQKDIQAMYPYLKHQIPKLDEKKKPLPQNQNLPIVQKKKVNDITQKLGEFYSQHLKAQKQKIEQMQKAQQDEIQKEELMKVNPIVTSFVPFKGDLVNTEQSDKYDPSNLPALSNHDIKETMGKTDSFIKLQKIPHDPLPNTKHESEIILKKEQGRYPQQYRLDRRSMRQSSTQRNLNLNKSQRDSLSYTKQKIFQEYKQAIQDSEQIKSSNSQKRDILTYRDRKKSISDFENTQVEKEPKSISREAKRLDYQFFEEKP